VSPTKTAEPIEIEIPFGMWTRVNPRKHALDGVQILTREGAILRAKRGLPKGHALICPAVDILKSTQQGAAPVRCRCRLGCAR